MVKIKGRIIILGKNGFIAKCLCNKLKKNKFNFISFSKEKLNLEKKTSIKILRNIVRPNDKIVVIHVTKNFLILINPMVPHLAEELWKILENRELISNESWPIVDLNYIQKNKVKIPIQVNGKVRAVIEVPIDSNATDVKEIALKEENVLKFLNKTPQKVIVIPNRVVNFVV